MRLFVAVNLPSDERRRLGEIVDELRGHDLPIRWVAADSLHITLKFLGDVAESARDNVIAGLDNAAATVRPFAVDIGGFGAFPSLNRARVFWIGVQAPAEMTKLQGAVQAEIEPLGFPREKRAFSPHLTLGRVKGEAKVARAEVDRIAHDVVYNASVEITSVELMRSHLSPRGARYDVLHSAKLRN